MKTSTESVVMGRPRIGLSRQVKITLPEWDWVKIEQSIDRGDYASMSAYFRYLHEKEQSSRKNE